MISENFDFNNIDHEDYHPDEAEVEVREQKPDRDAFPKEKYPKFYEATDEELYALSLNAGIKKELVFIGGDLTRSYEGDVIVELDENEKFRAVGHAATEYSEHVPNSVNADGYIEFFPA